MEVIFAIRNMLYTTAERSVIRTWMGKCATGTNNDRDIILTNVGSITPNNTRVQQLP